MYANFALLGFIVLGLIYLFIPLDGPEECSHRIKVEVCFITACVYLKKKQSILKTPLSYQDVETLSKKLTMKKFDEILRNINLIRPVGSENLTTVLEVTIINNQLYFFVVYRKQSQKY